MAKITVVVPVYGVEKYIAQFLDSIRKQTFRDFDVVFVDDGSKDNCPAILDEFVREDNRYHVIHQKNQGVSAARNTGLQYVTGQYVYIVDSDDWLEPTALENLWKEADKTEADLIYGNWISEMPNRSVQQDCFSNEFVTEDEIVINALRFAVNSNNVELRFHTSKFERIRGFGGAPWRALIRSSILKENNILFDTYVKGLGDDILFMLHVYQYVNKIAYISDIIYHYRKLDTSYSHGFKADYIDLTDRIFEKHKEFLAEYSPNNLVWDSYYMRVLLYLLQGMDRYLRNSGNSKSEKERYKEFKQLISRNPYRDAIKHMPVKYFANKRLLLSTLLLRWNLSWLYWKFAEKFRV